MWGLCLAVYLHLITSSQQSVGCHRKSNFNSSETCRRNQSTSQKNLPHSYFYPDSWFGDYNTTYEVISEQPLSTKSETYFSSDKKEAEGAIDNVTDYKDKQNINPKRATQSLQEKKENLFSFNTSEDTLINLGLKSEIDSKCTCEFPKCSKCGKTVPRNTRHIYSRHYNGQYKNEKYVKKSNFLSNLSDLLEDVTLGYTNHGCLNPRCKIAPDDKVLQKDGCCDTQCDFFCYDLTNLFDGINCFRSDSAIGTCIVGDCGKLDCSIFECCSCDNCNCNDCNCNGCDCNGCDCSD